MTAINFRESLPQDILYSENLHNLHITGLQYNIVSSYDGDCPQSANLKLRTKQRRQRKFKLPFNISFPLGSGGLVVVVRHSRLLQYSVSVPVLVHVAVLPPCSAMLHLLDLLLTPVPHVLLQLLHDIQVLHDESMAENGLQKHRFGP